MSVQNVGNTCYLSAMLQALIHTKTFDMYVKCLLRHPMNTVLHTYVTLHERVARGDQGVCPKSLIQQLGNFDNIFKSHEQQDAHQALLSLLNILRKYTPLCHTLYDFNKHGKIAWNRDKSHSIVDEIFGVQTYTVLTCKACKKSSRQYVNNFGLIVNLLNNDPIDIAINKDYNNEETLPVHCDNCKCEQIFLKKSKISHYPLALIVCTNKKEVNLDLQQIFGNRFTIDDTPYHLYAVIHHRGSTNLSGHYTTCVKPKCQWIMKNDETSYNMHTLHRYPDVHKNGYVFLYHKDAY